MNLHHLKTFYLAAKYENVSKAAAELGIAQPAATRHLKELQKDIGISLFETRGKKLYLTGEGKTLFSRAENIFNEEAYLISSIEEIKRSRHGVISIAVQAAYSDYYLPEALIQYHGKRPDIAINVSTFHHDGDIFSSIERMDHDIGITALHPESGLLASELILSVPLYLVVPKNHPLSSEKLIDPFMLDGQVFIMPDKSSKSRMQIDSYFRNNMINYQILYELGGIKPILDVVKKGIGVSIVCAKAVIEDVKRGELCMIPVSDPENSLSASFYMVHNREKVFNEGLEELMDFIKETGRKAEVL